MRRIECSAITHIGLIRTTNEDNYYINGKFKKDIDADTEGYADTAERDAYLYAVCDGMGGERLGELASLIAVMTLKQYQETDVRYTITEYIKKANRLICNEIKKYNGSRIGTTLALLYLRDNKAVACNIGDSRVYLSRNENLYLLTEDHTEAQRLVDMGVIDEEEANYHESRNKLTQHLGIFPEEMILEPFYSEEVKLKKDDIFVVCSDGLSSMVSDDDIADILSLKGYDTTELVKILASKAQEGGGRDNTTIIVVKVH